MKPLGLFLCYLLACLTIGMAAGQAYRAGPWAGYPAMSIGLSIILGLVISRSALRP